MSGNGTERGEPTHANPDGKNDKPVHEKACDSNGTSRCKKSGTSNDVPQRAKKCEGVDKSGRTQSGMNMSSSVRASLDKENEHPRQAKLCKNSENPGMRKSRVGSVGST